MSVSREEAREGGEGRWLYQCIKGGEVAVSREGGRGRKEKDGKWLNQGREGKGTALIKGRTEGLVGGMDCIERGGGRMDRGKE